jgi:hypothetical protein
MRLVTFAKWVGKLRQKENHGAVLQIQFSDSGLKNFLTALPVNNYPSRAQYPNAHKYLFKTPVRISHTVKADPEEFLRLAVRPGLKGGPAGKLPGAPTCKGH